MYYRLHIETGIATDDPREVVTPEIKGARDAARSAKLIYQALRSAGVRCTILRRDRSGRGRLLQPVVL